MDAIENGKQGTGSIYVDKETGNFIKTSTSKILAEQLLSMSPQDPNSGEWADNKIQLKSKQFSQPYIEPHLGELSVLVLLILFSRALLYGQ